MTEKAWKCTSFYEWTDVYRPCDPMSENYCCSPKGQCGSTENYCECAGCINTRTVEKFKSDIQELKEMFESETRVATEISEKCVQVSNELESSPYAQNFQIPEFCKTDG